MKKFLLIGLLIAILAVSACTNNNVGPDATQTYIGGAQGVLMKFSANAPPERVSDAGGDEFFDIVLELENLGEEKVLKQDALVSITGFPPGAFDMGPSELINVEPEEDLIPRIKTADGSIIEPPVIYATISDLHYIYNEPGNVEYPIRAKLCYLYATNVASKLCIKEDMNRDEEGDLCAVNSLREISSSGAPIQVTKIQQSGAGSDKTRFTFTVENRATGDAFKKGEKCENKNSIEDRVFIEIENILDRSAANAVNCVGLSSGGSDNGYITLTEGQSRDVSCTVTIQDRTDSLLPFNIKLSYDYQEIVDTSILIEYTPVEE